MNMQLHALVWSKVRDAMARNAAKAEKDGAPGAQKDCLALAAFAGEIAKAYSEV